jgi:hypothetical protein
MKKHLKKLSKKIKLLKIKNKKKLQNKTKDIKLLNLVELIKFQELF